MGEKKERWRPNRHNPIFRCIADKHRRAVLEALDTWGSPQTERQIANYLAAYEGGTPAINETDVDPIHAELVHRHLPALAEAGLVDWNRAGRQVGTTDHPAIEDPRFWQLLKIDDNALRVVFESLSHEYRRIVLTVLRERQSPMAKESLADEVLHRLPEGHELLSRDGDEVLVSLTHVHLPKLADAEFIEYDSETGRISYVAPPVLEEMFDIIFDPGDDLMEKTAGFFDELNGSLGQSRQDASTGFAWPHHWRRPQHD